MVLTSVQGSLILLGALRVQGSLVRHGVLQGQGSLFSYGTLCLDGSLYTLVLSSASGSLQSSVLSGVRGLARSFWCPHDRWLALRRWCSLLPRLALSDSGSLAAHGVLSIHYGSLICFDVLSPMVLSTCVGLPALLPPFRAQELSLRANRVLVGTIDLRPFD